LAVVLVATRNPLNIGAVARAMSNFGFANLRLVNPFQPSFREAKSAVGGTALLKKAEVYTNVAEAVADCSLVIGTTAVRNRKLDHSLRTLAEAATLIGTKLHRGSVALLFGSEKRGLSNEDLSYCHWLMRIPTVEGSPSMNLGQAVAVCLYELARSSNRPADKVKTPTSENLDRLSTLLLDALVKSRYLKQDPSDLAQEKIRRLVRRLNLPSEDVDVWLGMFRQMLWKMWSST
jgi:TrmH family RNA methyltransferase